MTSPQHAPQDDLVERLTDLCRETKGWPLIVGKADLRRVLSGLSKAKARVAVLTEEAASRVHFETFEAMRERADATEAKVEAMREGLERAHLAMRKQGGPTLGDLQEIEVLLKTEEQG